MVSCNSKERQTKEENLRTNVDLFMKGHAVPRHEFPWFQVGKAFPDKDILRFYLETRKINRDEFEVLARPIDCWKRE